MTMHGHRIKIKYSKYINISDLLPAEIAMKSIRLLLAIIIIASTLLFTIPSPLANSVINQEISINTIDDTYKVEENLIIEQSQANISFYVQPGINDLSVIINNTNIDIEALDNNVYQINYSQGLASDQTTIIITYSYPKQASKTFTKQFFYNTSSFSVTLDERNLVSHENIIKDTTLTLYLPDEQNTTQSINLFTTILIGLLVVLLIVTTIYGLKKRKNGVKRNREVDTSELLTTEKALLMNLLKEIEKKHRDKKISDETYEKLKTHYKQQTVDIMSNLED